MDTARENEKKANAKKIATDGQRTDVQKHKGKDEQKQISCRHRQKKRH